MLTIHSYNYFFIFFLFSSLYGASENNPQSLGRTPLDIVLANRDMPERKAALECFLDVMFKNLTDKSPSEQEIQGLNNLSREAITAIDSGNIKEKTRLLSAARSFNPGWFEFMHIVKEHHPAYQDVLNKKLKTKKD